MKIVALTAIVAVTVGLTGCGDHPRAQGPTAREMDAIRSTVNGLYFSPHLLAERGSVFDIADSLTASTLVGAPARLKLDSGLAAKLRDEAIAVHPIVGRSRLLELQRVGGPRLDASDTAAVQALRRADGSYGTDADSTLDQRVLSTEGALAVLTSQHALTPAQLSSSMSWLAQVARTAPGQETVTVAVRAMRNYNPAASSPRLTAPDLTTLPQLSAYDQRALVARAAAYTGATGAPKFDPKAVRDLFATNVDSADPETLLQLVRLMHAIGATPAQLAPATRRLEAARLTDGTYRNTDSTSGSSIATVYALRLLKQRGEAADTSGTADPAAAYAEVPDVRSRSQERLLALGTAVIAGRGTLRGQVQTLCVDPRTVPQRIDADSVVGWYELSTVCKDAGVNPAAPQSWTPWKADTEQHIVAQAFAVLGLHTTGSTAALPAFIDRKAMLQYVRQRSATANLTDLSVVATAYLTLTGGEDRELLDGLRARAQAAKGCRDLPTFYRNQPTDDSCDLRTTVAAEAFLSE